MSCTWVSHDSVHVGFRHAGLTHQRADVWALVMCQQSASQLLSVLGIIVAWFKMLKNILAEVFEEWFFSLLSVCHSLNSAFFHLF